METNESPAAVPRRTNQSHERFVSAPLVRVRLRNSHHVYGILRFVLLRRERFVGRRGQSESREDSVNGGDGTCYEEVFRHFGFETRVEDVIVEINLFVFYDGLFFLIEFIKKEESTFRYIWVCYLQLKSGED